jgi:hypothetical protein
MLLFGTGAEIRTIGGACGADEGPESSCYMTPLILARTLVHTAASTVLHIFTVRFEHESIDESPLFYQQIPLSTMNIAAWMPPSASSSAWFSEYERPR